MVRERIEKSLREALKSMGAGNAVFVVERPADMAHGDYATNAAFSAAKLLKKSPKDVAEELAAQLSGIEGVKQVSALGGFLNFQLSFEELSSRKREIPQLHTGKLVLVEYTSPNLFKPLHIGNLVGNIMGESIARLLEATGASVARLNYPSDIGLTVAKGVWGLVQHKLDAGDIAELGKAYVLGNEAYENGNAKKEIEEVNRALYEETNAELSALRAKGIETSRRHLDELCERLGTRFDREFFESESGLLGRDIVRAYIGSVFEESDGAVVYRGEEEGFHTRVFLSSQGLPTYEAKEVGLFKLKSDAYPNFDSSLTVTGAEQKGFFEVVFAAIRKTFPQQTEGRELRHVANGFLRLTTGKMSSRKGNVITGESLLEETTKAARGREDVAIAALKYTVLKSGSGKDIVFDPEQSLLLEGDSGPYLQYALVRSRALLIKAAEAKQVPAVRAEGDEDIAAAGLMYRLKRVLVHYPDAVARASNDLEPHYIATYLMELASTWSSWYGTERLIVNGEILSDRIELIEARLKIAEHNTPVRFE